MNEHSPPVVEVAGARVLLGSSEVLHGIDLRVDSGEMVALLGANGSGKSTLLRTIVGILPLSGGTAQLFGMPVSRARSHDRVGYVPQDSSDGGSIPATARETVATGLLGARTWRPRVSDPRVAQALGSVGMADMADRPITRMSGGQRRRVMIARALVRAPEFLVLDEPFSGVDLSTQEMIGDLFRKLSARGTTILVVLHEIGPLDGALSRAVVLDHGRLVHDGAVADRPLLDPGHDHAHADNPITECLGQELHPA